ncbi:MAG: hypothetical protein CMJ58_00800 [Planctomycetaceae bacterium]|nr:hypothetical protein [Planctomycetaceae bacterium]
MNEWGRRNGEWGRRRDHVDAPRAHRRSLFRLPHSAFRLRSGVTLVELMVTMAILAILAAAIYGATAAAMESSRLRRTQSLITKLDNLLTERWQSYETRRVEILFQNGTPQGRALAFARLAALRTTMMLEMPDRWSDLLGGIGATAGLPIDNQMPSVATAPTEKSIGNMPLDDRANPSTTPATVAYPPLAQAYLRRYNSLTSSDPDVIRRNQGAECLYMIIMYATGDGEARTLFSEQDIDDTDGDGAPEFVDGWGRPIEFIRWPTGYVVRSDVMTGDAQTDHDPFDPFRVTPPVALEPVNPSRQTLIPTQYANAMNGLVAGFRLLPLIYSRGADGDSDLTALSSSTAPFNQTFGYLDPYQLTRDPDLGDYYLGIPSDGDEDGDEGWLDNVTNHNLGE